jgi:hypothetical protein
MPAISASIPIHTPEIPLGEMGLTASAPGCGPDVFGKPGSTSWTVDAEVLVTKFGSPL